MKNELVEYKKETKFGKEVITDVKADELRRKQCMCWNCHLLIPNSPDNCTTAQKLYDTCVDDGVAVMITRCSKFKEKGLL